MQQNVLPQKQDTLQCVHMLILRNLCCNQTINACKNYGNERKITNEPHAS